MKAFVPEITNLKERNVLTITTFGDPNKLDEIYMKALYGTAYGMKMKVFKPKDIKMEIRDLSAFWPDAHVKPKDQWTGIWNLEVPDYVIVSDLLQKDKNIVVTLRKLSAGKVAQILHLGSFLEEGPTVAKLLEFIKENNLEIIGDHEEVYLTKPGVKNQKTIIRYLVQ